jgi:hypothetical protein
MKLKERAAGSAVAFTGTYHGSQTEMPRIVRRGDHVQIGIADDAGYLVDVRVLGDGHYGGRLERFIESGDECVGGASIGDWIEFRNAHLIACYTP